jgi:hypothetical protein
MLRTLLALVILTGLAHADDRADFASDIKEATGAYHDQFTIAKLSTFKLSAKCWKKMHDKNENGIHTATFWVGYVRDFAKRSTGDDWNATETANNSDRENNKGAVEKQVNAFASKFSFTLANDGADCDTTTGSLMLRYWTTIGDALQYLSGKKQVAIVLNVTGKTKDVTVVTRGRTITITASRDVEPGEWDQKILKGIKASKL